MTLCPEAADRAAMTDAEFWDHVLTPPGDPRYDDEAYYPDPDDPTFTVTPCPVCGSSLSSCGYDDEGRPMIHASAGEDS